MFNRVMRSCCLILLALMSTLSRADDVAEFAALTQQTQSYQANFEQKITDQFGTVKDQSSGRFVIKKPYRFIWETTAPYEQLITSNGETLWTFDRDLDQVNIQTLNKAVGNTPVLLLEADSASLAKTFNVKKLVSGSETAQTFELMPLEQGYSFERLLVQFVDGQLKELYLQDTLGQKTIVTFSEVKVNLELADNKFEFVIPEDVDIVDSRESTELGVDLSSAAALEQNENE